MFGISYKNLEETTQLLTPFILINNASLDIKEVSFLDAVNEIGAIYQSEFKDNLYKVYNDEWFYRNFKYIYSLTNGSYVNFPYNRLINYNFNYYGKNPFRLKCVKKKYDPLNVFTFPQGI